MELLDAILLLKELRMPLKEIQELLGKRSPERMLEVFSEREEKIQEEMTKLKNMKRWIAHRKERIETGLHINTDEIRFSNSRSVSIFTAVWKAEMRKKVTEKPMNWLPDFWKLIRDLKVIMKLLIYSMGMM